MPQASRNHSTNAQRVQDKEAKRARGVMSCAECRRLKLKCDKTVPCSSCKRRGCESICPNGSLITGQGTRFVLADTEKLHHKITQMSDRIRQLEDALFVLQSTVSKETHPLLDRELLLIKSSIDLHSAVDSHDGPVEAEEVDESQYIDAFGTLAIRDDGTATFYGRSAGSESLLIDGEASPSPDSMSRSIHRTTNSVWKSSAPDMVTSLAESFPFITQAPGTSLENLVDKFLPQWSDAWRLCEFYLEQAPWFFGAVTKRQVYEEILPLWYPDNSHGSSSSFRPGPQMCGLQSSASAVPGPSRTPPSKGTAHDLALLFVIFCFGALTDDALPPAPDNPVAHQYFQLTRAALTLEPVIDRTPSVATVQTLSLMAIYEGLCSGDNSIERTWALMGLATKLAQSIGLHKDCARFKLPPSEVQKRRALFWELFITDCWQSLATGRLPSFALPFVDCELPYDTDQTMADDGSIQPSFPFWKARFGAECVSAVVQGTLTSRAPKYSIILQLDRKIRDMAMPSYSLGAPPQGAGLSQTMQHFMPINYREFTLLYIHRCFFAHAISSYPSDPIKSPYAPSFLAGYRSACEVITGLEAQFSIFPSQIARFWVLWTHAFSSSVMLSSVVIHCTKNKVASAALIELRRAYDLFEKASQYGGRAVKFLPIIQRLWTKAQKVYQDAHNGIHHPAPNDIFTLSTSRDINDELSIFGGRTHSVVTKSASPPMPAVDESSQARSLPGPSPVHDSISSNPAFAGMHPTLAEQLHQFESHIRAQIRNAYQVQHSPSQQSQAEYRYDQQQTTSYQHHSVYQQGGEYSQSFPEESPPSSRHPALHSAPQATYGSMNPASSHELARANASHSIHQPVPQSIHADPQPQRVQQHDSQPAGPQSYHRHEHHHYHYPPRDQQPIPPPPYDTPAEYHGRPAASQSAYPHAGRQCSTSRIDQPANQPTHTNAAGRSMERQQTASHSHPYHSPPQHGQHESYAAGQSSQPTARQYSHHQTQQPPQMVQQWEDYAGQAESHASYPAPSFHHNSLEEPAYPSSTELQSHPPSATMEYWPVNDGVYYHDDQYRLRAAQAGTAQHPSHYTPDAALHGIAADDSGLQETWLSYMNQVGAPRHIFDD